MIYLFVPENTNFDEVVEDFIIIEASSEEEALYKFEEKQKESEDRR